MPTGVYTHRSQSLVDRFWGHVRLEGECWRWTGAHTSRGYGNLELPGLKPNGLRRRIVPATHVAWFVATGSWPIGQMNHECSNRWCVNPAHLYDGTQVENMEDLARQGHPTRKLSALQAQEVRALVASGLTHKEVGVLYGISRRTVGTIVQRLVYRY